MTPTFAVLLPSLRKAQPGYARPGGSLPPDPPRAGGILPPDPPLSRSGPPSCPSYTRTPNRASPGRGGASPRTPLVPDPPPPHHDQFQNTLSRIAKNRPVFFFYKFDTRPRRTSPGPTTKKKRVLSGLLFPLHREMCAARRRVRYINVPTCFGRNCPLFFLKLGEKKHPPSARNKALP